MDAKVENEQKNSEALKNDANAGVDEIKSSENRFELRAESAMNSPMIGIQSIDRSSTRINSTGNTVRLSNTNNERGHERIRKCCKF